MKYIGIDGCKKGWFLIGLDQDDSGAFGVLDNINEISDYLDSADLILLDIPIGLRSEHKDERLCDKLARSILKGGRGSSVFPAPSRCALPYTEYKEASEQNFRCTGRKLSQQSFAIIPKIREADTFLRNNKTNKLREMHPEVCFWAMNDGISMSHNKKSAEGFEERIIVLERYYSKSRYIVEMALAEYRRKDVARDDIVDALVGAIAASKATSAGLSNFPDEPEVDEQGLPMEIVYWMPLDN